MKPLIFISRSLNENSPFQKLKNEGHTIIDQSLIDIIPINVEDYPTTDWIFFYSANGVKYFFESQEYSTDYQYGVMGTGTANTFYSVTGRSPKYTGNGIPQDIADNFITYEKGQSILFVKAKNSKDSIKNLLIDYMECSDLIVYENAIKKDFELPQCTHLLFTSPLNVEAYLSKYDYSREKLYAIGQSSADAILALCGTEAKVSEETTISGLYSLIRKDIDPK